MFNKEKVQYINFSVIIILCIIFLFVIGYKFNSSFFDFLTGNVTPELIGIGVEILIIIWVFDFWQRRKEYEKNIINEKRLREYLLFFLKHGFKDFPKENKVTKFYGGEHPTSTKEIAKAIEYLRSNNIESYTLLSMKELLLVDKSAIENLLEVASLLTDKHFKSWIRIVYFINRLSQVHDEDEAEIKTIIISILNRIDSFDKASYDSNIYVNAPSSLNEISLKKINKNISSKVKYFFYIILFTISLILLFPFTNETDTSSEKKPEEPSGFNTDSTMFFVDSMNLILTLMITSFLFFSWLYYKYYKNTIPSLKNTAVMLIISSILSISVTSTLSIIELKIEKLALLDNPDITFYKEVNNEKIFSPKYKEKSYEFLKTINPLYIYFDKGSILTDKEDSLMLNEIFNKGNKYIVKLTGFSSTEVIKSQNSLSNNYQISLARANNVKKTILDILDKNEISRDNIIIDIFAHSNQNITSSIVNKHWMNRKVKIEITVFENKKSS